MGVPCDLSDAQFEPIESHRVQLSVYYQNKNSNCTYTMSKHFK